jgi:hypothetical protein
VPDTGNPYIFSYPPFGTDTVVQAAYPTYRSSWESLTVPLVSLPFLAICLLTTLCHCAT